MKYRLSEVLTEFKEVNKDSLYEPVAVGKYGIRKRNEIYKKELSDDYSKNKVIRKDNLIIGMGSNQIDVGVMLYDEVYSVSPAYHTYKINTEVIHSDYLELLFKSNNATYFKKYSIATARQGKKIDLKALLEEKIDVPSFEEQDNVVSKINNIEELIAEEEKSILLLDELIKSRFIELFGDVNTNSKGLPLKCFDKIAINLDSKRVPITEKDRTPGPYPYYGASGIVDYVNDWIYDEDILLISEDGANLLARSTPIAFSVSGKCWVNNHAHVVKFSNQNTRKYIEYYFEQISIEKYVTGAAQPKFSQGKLNSMLIPYADEASQAIFATFVEQIDKLKFNCRYCFSYFIIYKF